MFRGDIKIIVFRLYDNNNIGNCIYRVRSKSIYTYPVMYNWSRGGPTGSAPSDMGHAMCSKESRTITSQAVTCVVPVHSETRSHRTNRPRLPWFLRRNIVIVSNLCCWLWLPLLPGIAANVWLYRVINEMYCYTYRIL